MLVLACSHLPTKAKPTPPVEIQDNTAELDGAPGITRIFQVDGVTVRLNVCQLVSTLQSLLYKAIRTYTYIITIKIVNI